MKYREPTSQSHVLSPLPRCSNSSGDTSHHKTQVTDLNPKNPKKWFLILIISLPLTKLLFLQPAQKGPVQRSGGPLRRRRQGMLCLACLSRVALQSTRSVMRVRGHGDRATMSLCHYRYGGREGRGGSTPRIIFFPIIIALRFFLYFSIYNGWCVGGMGVVGAEGE